MSYLSTNQLKQYEDDGFVSPINIFSKEKAKEIRREIELIEKEIPWVKDAIKKNYLK
jgi:non-haem Fe2+, alpha-ketoglutarate-dependent halogenase